MAHFRFQIPDFRFQIPDPDTRGGRFFAGDFRFQVSDPRRHKGRNIDGKQNSKRAEHISRLHRRFLRHPDFRFQIPKLARFLISDFRLRISDPRMPSAPRQRFQISDFRFQTSRARSASLQISDFRSQSGAGDVVYPLQISDFRFQTPECLPRMRVCQKSRCHISECRIQIPYTKEYRLEGPRRRPDNIGQIPMEKMLSPVLPSAAPTADTDPYAPTLPPIFSWTGCFFCTILFLERDQRAFFV